MINGIRIIAFFLFFTAAQLRAENRVLIQTPAGGDFRLNGTQGRIDTENLRGKNIFLYFGFTHCPQVCPLTNSRLKQMINLLPENAKDEIRVVFVSVDNIRDNLSTLKKYIQPYGPQFVAATGSDKVLTSVLQKFGARFARYWTPSKVLLVDHTSSVFVINKKGEWTHTLEFDAAPEEYLRSYQESDSVSSEKLKQRRDVEATQIGHNSKCDLAVNECKVMLSKDEFLSIRLSPGPIRLQEQFNIVIKTNGALIPSAIDFTGVERSMGFIRPKLILQPDGSYTAKATLPICELKKMKWNLNLILTDARQSHLSALFHLETKD